MKCVCELHFCGGREKRVLAWVRAPLIQLLPALPRSHLYETHTRRDCNPVFAHSKPADGWIIAKYVHHNTPGHLGLYLREPWQNSSVACQETLSNTISWRKPSGHGDDTSPHSTLSTSFIWHVNTAMIYPRTASYFCGRFICGKICLDIYSEWCEKLCFPYKPIAVREEFSVSFLILSNLLRLQDEIARDLSLQFKNLLYRESEKCTTTSSAYSVERIYGKHLNIAAALVSEGFWSWFQLFFPFFVSILRFIFLFGLLQTTFNYLFFLYLSELSFVISKTIPTLKKHLFTSQCWFIVGIFYVSEPFVSFYDSLHRIY